MSLGTILLVVLIVLLIDERPEEVTELALAVAGLPTVCEAGPALPAENSLATIDTKNLQQLRDALRNTAQYWRALPQDGNSANGVRGA